MVTRPGKLLLWVVSRVLASVTFSQRNLDAVRDAQQRGAVLHVMRSRNIVDYLYFNVSFLREHLQLSRFANGLRTWMLRPVPAGLAALVRGRRGLGSDSESLQLILEDGQPGLVFLARPGKQPAQDAEFSRPLLEAAVAIARVTERPITALPQLLVWDKRPDSVQPSLLDDVFGTRQSPGLVRRLFNVVQNTWQSFLQLGEPTVELGDPIQLQHLIAEHPDEDDRTLAQRLHRMLVDSLEREERVIVGPRLKPASELRDEILADPRTQQALVEAAETHQLDRTKLVRNARGILKEIAADFNLLTIKWMSSVLTLVWHQIYEGIDVDFEGLQRVRNTARTHRLVIVPSHKSHIDYLVISYVFYRNGLIPPHIAAGVNLSFWPLGPVFRRAGAFFLRRSFSGDPIYAALFDAYLVKLLEEGFSIEFFIEGTRSRTGKLNAPKYGMLNMIVDAWRSGDVERLAFVPVSVGYENIIEGSSYRAELQGGEKKSENLGALLRTPQVLRSRYGRVYVEFGEPVDVDTFLARYHEAPKGELAREELERSVRRLAYRIIHGINDVTTVSPSALAALVLLHDAQVNVSLDVLVRRAGFVLGVLAERNCRLSGTLRTAVDSHAAYLARVRSTPIDLDQVDDFDREYADLANRRTADHKTATDVDGAVGHAVASPLREALRLLQDKKLVHQVGTADAPMFVVEGDRRIELSFYRNNIVHYLVAEAVFATSVRAVAVDAAGAGPSKALVRRWAAFLSRLFKYEFCFEERDRFDAVFDRSAAWFAEHGWMGAADDRGRFGSPQFDERAIFVADLLIPTLEAYWIAAVTLRGLAEDTIEEKNLTRRAVTIARGYLQDGTLRFEESVSRPTIETCWRVFREWGIVVPVEDVATRRRGRLLRLQESYNGPLLTELVEALDALRQGRVAPSGSLLRRIVPDVHPTGPLPIQSAADLPPTEEIGRVVP